MTRFTDSLVKRIPALMGIVLLAGVMALSGWTGGSARGADPTPTTIKRVDTPLFSTLDYYGGVFEFSEGLMDFWIEVEADGKTSTLFDGESKNLKVQVANLAKAAKRKLSSGHLAWVVHFQDGKEVWDFGVTVLDADGKVKVSARAIGVSPHGEATSKARLTEVDGPSRAFKLDKEATLFTIWTTDEKGKVIRTARLKVGPVK